MVTIVHLVVKLPVIVYYYTRSKRIRVHQYFPTEPLLLVRDASKGNYWNIDTFLSIIHSSFHGNHTFFLLYWWVSLDTQQFLEFLLIIYGCKVRLINLLIAYLDAGFYGRQLVPVRLCLNQLLGFIYTFQCSLHAY